MAKRPKNTFDSVVFNAGIGAIGDLLPVGFVRAVYYEEGDINNPAGSLAGFMRNGKFYSPGEDVPAETKDPTVNMSSEEKLSLVNQALGTAQLEMDRSDVGSDKYNKAKEAFQNAKNMVAELEPTIKAEKSKTKSSDIIKKNKEKLASLEEKKQRLTDQGQSTTKIDNEINKLKNSIATEETKLKPVAKTTGKIVAAAPQTVRQADAVPSKTIQADIPAAKPSTKQIVSKTETPLTPSKKTPASKKDAKTETKAQRQAQAQKLLDEYAIIDAVVGQDQELKQALADYANEKITKAELDRRIKNSRFVATNSKTIRERLTARAVYTQLTPEERDQDTSGYAISINNLTASIIQKARAEGSAISEEDARKSAEKLYITGQETMPGAVSAVIRPYIKVGMTPEGVATVGGVAGSNYRELLSTAEQNGIKMNQLPSVLGYKTLDDALQQLAAGESIDTLKQRVRNYASAGQSDFVKNQLAQGVDLRTVAQPYITAMANVLELNPDQINLNDQTLQAGLQNNGMNIFDYQRFLKKDNRWQYTQNAEKEVASKGMKLLQDFGLEAL